MVKEAAVAYRSDGISLDAFVVFCHATLADQR